MMNARCIRFAPVLLYGLFISGCQTLPVVPRAIDCDVNAELLASKCRAPGQVAGDATYASLVDTMQNDRKALLECGITVNTLRDALKRCNQATVEYNNKIDSINRNK
jgi:hypothetical protein